MAQKRLFTNPSTFELAEVKSIGCAVVVFFWFVHAKLVSLDVGNLDGVQSLSPVYEERL